MAYDLIAPRTTGDAASSQRRTGSQGRLNHVDRRQASIPNRHDQGTRKQWFNHVVNCAILHYVAGHSLDEAVHKLCWRVMILKQFYLPCLAHASYIIGDEESGTAAVVDPQRDTDQYVAFAAEHGLKIKHVFLTHFHADFV